MKKEALSPEEQTAENAVRQMEHLVNNQLEIAFELRRTLYAAFDDNNPEKWPEIVAEAKSALCPHQTEMNRIYRKLEKCYVKD